MNKKICVTSRNSLGCTFIDWSLYFLSGQTQHYNVKLGQWIPLSQNPLTKINAHEHDKNHPSGHSSTNRMIEQFNLLPDAMYSMYPVELHFDAASKLTKIPVDQFYNPAMFSQIIEYINDDYNKLLQDCHKQQFQVIYVQADHRMLLYHQNIRSLDRYQTKPGSPESEQDKRNELQEVFFKNSLLQWKELVLTEVWDVRERTALDIRPLAYGSDYNVNLQFPHHWVNSLDLWTRTENTIKKIMSYLDLEIVPDRWQSWLPICKEWQEQQLLLLDFCYNQPHIVESIESKCPSEQNAIK